MKRFRFALQPVALLRAHRELRAREALGEALQGVARAEGELTLVRDRQERFESAVRAARSARFLPGDETQVLAAYRQECAVEAKAEREVEAARSTLHRCRGEYLAAKRGVEVLSKLEQKARHEHRLEAYHEEQAALDDFATIRFSRRSNHRAP
jgi:flagellar FliJ protein